MTTMALGIVLTFNNNEVAATTLSPKIDANSHYNIVLVRGGCGVGHHRSWGGFCVPNWDAGRWHHWSHWHHWHHWHHWRRW